MNATSILACMILCCVAMPAQYSWRLILPITAYTVQVNPLDPNKLYVGNRDDQFWRSYDGGTGWERFVHNEFQQQDALSSVIVSSADTNVVIVGGYRINGIYRSTDGGRTVAQVLTDSTHSRTWFVSEAIIEDPSDNHRLYAARGSASNTIYRSTDIGLTWESICVIDASLTTGLCTIAIRPDSTNILFVGAKGGTILRSDDAGRTFYKVPVLGTSLNIFDDSEIPKIVFSPLYPMTGYAVVAFANSEAIIGNGGLLKTTNGGASWNRVAYSDTSLWSVEVRASSLGTDDVFIGGFRENTPNTIVDGDSLVARSLDGGSTWSRFNNITWSPNEIEELYANVWVLRYNKPSNKLYMATECGLYVFDEPTSVTAVIKTHASLRTTITANVLRVIDIESPSVTNVWTLYDMQGSAVATGLVDASNEFTLSLSGFASGAYLMTWGNDTHFRTISFAITR